MPAFALWTILSLSSTQAPPPAKPLSAEVVISGRLIQVPALPVSVEQARAESRSIQLQLTQSQQDLEVHLRVIQQTLEGRPCPTSIKAPKSKEEDIRFLLSVLKDEQYESMEKQFFGTWDTWQTALIQKGLAAGSAQPPALLVDPKREMSHDKPGGFDPSERRAFAFGSDDVDPFLVGLCTRVGPDRKVYVDREAYNKLAEVKVSSFDRSDTSRQIKNLADKMAPDLTKSWIPLVAHLYSCAIRFGELEQKTFPDEPSDLRLLRLYANRAFLERIRSATWLCGVVWAKMTSDTIPPPPKPLIY